LSVPSAGFDSIPNGCSAPICCVDGIHHLRRPYTSFVVGLFAFDSHRAHDVFGSQDAQLFLRVGITDILGMFPTFVGLIPQIDRAWRHGRGSRPEITLGQRPEWTAVKTAH
jgi:hypothetical protein